ncbi:MAG: serine hydroxymethyltransferase, partial [Gemmatimonadota bacterium]
VDEAENLARDRATALFGADHANVQPHSGAQANMAAYFALLEPGDTVLGMDLSHGGHLTHGSPVNFSGQLYRFLPYGVREGDETVDFEALREMALRERPAMIVAGASAYPRTLPFERHPSPVPWSDVVTSTTHKTLRGPRGGLILCTEEHSRAIDKAVFPGMQGGPLMHVIAAKAVALHEASVDSFRLYAERVVQNARVLAEELGRCGYRLVAGGTDTHLMLVDLRNTDLSGKDASNALGRAGITVNKNTVPFETRSPFVTSGIRIGTPALTTRGMGPDEMRWIAARMHRVLQSANDDAVLTEVHEEVREFTSAYPLVADPGTVAQAAIGG